MDDREKYITEVALNPVLAHDALFGDEHKNDTTPYHRQMIRLMHSDDANGLGMCFRGFGKSTIGEEAVVVQGALKRTKNIIILCENEDRAIDRLRQVKHFYETNEILHTVFDVVPGHTWQETKAVTSTGVIYQAYGRGQSLRGAKYLEGRPDYILLDDLEDLESVATPEARRKTRKWLTSTVLPALEPGGRVRMLATPLNPEALAPTLAKDPAWTTITVPIMFRQADGQWVPTWPDRFPVEFSLKMWEDMKRLGQSEDFMQEYLCEATDPSVQTFTADMLRVVPQARRKHEATYAIYDPARTTHKTSATTGKVVASWRGSKLIVWQATAKRMSPSEIVADMFEVDAAFQPVAIGFEENGLNEWALQPIRTAQAQRGVTLPLRPLRAPKGKLDFIRGLQPYFAAHEVEFACDMPDLRDQLLGFPTGLIDAPNALAYMLKLRVGLPIYENFREENIVAEMAPVRGKPLWLCVNADGQIVTGVLCQMHQGHLRVLADWLAEGDPGQVLRDILGEATLSAPSSGSRDGKTGVAGVSPGRAGPRLLVPRSHFERVASIGLIKTGRLLTGDVTKGGDIGDGREELRRMTAQRSHGEPALQVAETASWSLRAFSGGYARALDATEPAENAYRVLMEGLEAFAGLLRTGALADDRQANYGYTPDGRRFLSALAR